MALLYPSALVAGLLLPRQTPDGSQLAGPLQRVIHEILFLSGPLEIFLNFLIFIPFFLVLLYVMPGLSRAKSAAVSCLVSATAELAQSQILGRVSSWRDFLSNCLGVVLSYALISLVSVRKRVVEV